MIETEKLIPKSTTTRNPRTTNKAASVFFYGLILGFMFSFLFIYSNVVQESSSSSSFEYIFENLTDEYETENLGEYLYNTQRVLCVVMTNYNQINESGHYIMTTWAKRCNQLIFFSDKNHPNFTNIIISSETDNFARLREAFKYIYGNHLHNYFDWLLKVEVDTFIVMENLRYLLYQYDNQWPLIIGQRYLDQDYMIGTYVLSKESLIRLVENAFPNQKLCSKTGHSVDIELGKCCEHVDIIKIDGIDDERKGMFFREKPEFSLFPTRTDNKFDQYYYHKLKQGIEHCCSDRVIAIHNFPDKYLYYLEYFIYKVKTFGRHRNREELPRKKTLENVVKNYFLK